ncbi:MAG: metallophosphoesterase [Paludibacteraceae bacterium]|nr:metallophosphoesterase [Paludibacteraceae bacterium]
MRRWIKIVLPSALLAVGVVICALRWQAWFGMPEEPHWHGETIDYTFPTFAGDTLNGFVRTTKGWQDTQSPASLDILVLGDVHNRLQKADYDSLAARVPIVDALIQTGDWLDRGYPYYYQLLLREWTPSALEGLPVITCAGNHEYDKGFRKAIAPQWNTWFPQPVDTTLGIEGANYIVDFPQVRFIILDTNPLNRLVRLTRTLTWLKAAMNAAKNKRIIVLMHHPVLSAAKGRVNPLIYATFRYTLSQADLVLAGHDHSYVRQTPFVVINTSGKPKAQKNLSAEFTSTDPAYGVLHFEPAQTGQKADWSFCVYRLSDGVQIDGIYGQHD